jgi:hypothetical protein
MLVSLRAERRLPTIRVFPPFCNETLVSGTSSVSHIDEQHYDGEYNNDGGSDSEFS